MIYWPMGFLRMGTGGMTAQATGRGDVAGQALTLYRGLGVALVVSLLLIILQRPLLEIMLIFMEPDAATATFVREYFGIVIWGAPAVLSTYVMTGWLLGMQSAKKPMAISIIINIVNISISPALSFGAGLKLQGVAIGTLTAQWVGALVGLWLCSRYRPSIGDAKLLDFRELKKYFAINGDIILRTFCLIAVTLWFTREGALRGETMLAVNALLMQLFLVFSYMADGFAYAGEAIAGRLVGAHDVVGLRQCVKELLGWGLGFALLFSLIYFVCGEGLLGLMTDNDAVLDGASDYLPWAVTVPLAGFLAFTWDGIYIGVTATRAMLYSMGIATTAFFGVYFALKSQLGNHALWLAFVIYLILRGTVQSILWKKIFKKISL